KMNRMQRMPISTGIIMSLAVFIISCSNHTDQSRSNHSNASRNTKNTAEIVVTSDTLAVSQSKYLGNIIGNPYNIPANFDDYWNQVTPENAGKWGALEPSRGNWNWGPLDQIYNYAQSLGLIFKE